MDKASMIGIVLGMVALTSSLSIDIPAYDFEEATSTILPTPVERDPTTITTCEEKISEQLSQSQQQNRDKSVKLVVSLVKLGQFVEAYQEFSSLEIPLEQVGKVVKGVFQDNKSTQKGRLNGIIGFVGAMMNGSVERSSNCGVFSQVLKTLVKEMERSEEEESQSSDRHLDILQKRLRQLRQMEHFARRDRRRRDLEREEKDDSSSSAEDSFESRLNFFMRGHHHENSEEEENIKLPHSNVLILYYDYLEKCGDSSPVPSATPSPPHPFTELVDRVIQNWAKEIQTRGPHWSEMLKFLQDPQTNSTAGRFYPEIMRVAFSGNHTVFDKVARFNGKVENTKLRALGWLTLLEGLETINDTHSKNMVKLAFRVWNYTRSFEKKSFEPNEQVLGMYKSIKERIPEKMAAMFWGSRCVIKNVVTGALLSVDDQAVQAGSDEGPKGNPQLWQLEPFMKHYRGADNDVVHISVKTLNWKRDTPYLAVKMDQSPRKKLLTGKVHTSHKTDKGSRRMTNWILDPVTTEEGLEAFQMWAWNEDWNRFDLYVDVGGNGNVLAKEDAYKLKQSYWLINCE